MDIVAAFVSGISRFIQLPVTVLSTLLSNYMFIIFFGGLIFVIANTPQANLEAVYAAFKQLLPPDGNGDFSAVIDAVVDASIAFAGNVEHNFNPEQLSQSLTRSVCKIMNFTGLGSCTE